MARAVALYVLAVPPFPDAAAESRLRTLLELCDLRDASLSEMRRAFRSLVKVLTPWLTSSSASASGASASGGGSSRVTTFGGVYVAHVWRSDWLALVQVCSLSPLVHEYESLTATASIAASFTDASLAFLDRCLSRWREVAQASMQRRPRLTDLRKIAANLKGTIEAQFRDHSRELAAIADEHDAVLTKQLEAELAEEEDDDDDSFAGFTTRDAMLREAVPASDAFAMPSAAAASAPASAAPSRPSRKKDKKRKKRKRRAEVEADVARTRSIMAESIDKVVDRGERLDDLMTRSESLAAESAQFAAQARKPKVEIDDVFADMENTFNGMSALLVSCEPDRWWLATRRWYVLACGAPWWLLFTLLVYTGVFSFLGLIILPACFVLLLVRTTVVERSVENFEQRQEVLAGETSQKKTLRFIALAVRALPMLFLIGGLPVAIVYVIIPEYGLDAVPFAVGGHVALILVLQVLGTVRASHSFNERMRQMKARRAGLAQAPAGALRTEHVATRFRWKNVRNLVAIFTLLVEAFQLATFSIQSINDHESDRVSLGQSAAADAKLDTSWIGTELLPRVFLDVSDLITSNVAWTYLVSAAGAAGLLLFVFLVQFLRELRTFGHLKRDGKQREASDFLFFSFGGAVIFGHGDMKHVGSKVAMLVTLLADTLFLIVCGKLLLLLTCASPDGVDYTVLLLQPSMRCWEGEHRLIAVLALVAFAVYMPLATMIAPMLTENDQSGGDGAYSGTRQKDVSFAKPYLSVITVSKCALLISAGFFAQNEPSVTVGASAVFCVFLFVVTVLWTRKPSHDSLLLLAMGVHASEADERAKRVNMVEPAMPSFVNVLRALSFLGGAWGGLVAYVAFLYPDLLDGDIKYIVLGAGLGLLVLAGLIWYSTWHREFKRSASRHRDPEMETEMAIR